MSTVTKFNRLFKCLWILIYGLYSYSAIPLSSCSFSAVLFVNLSCCSTLLKAMLSKYGPSVPQELLHKLVNAFGELRSRADQGLISYPYSTREVVSVVKHLQVTIAPSRNVCYVIYVTQLVTQCILDVVRQVTVVPFARNEYHVM